MTVILHSRKSAKSFLDLSGAKIWRQKYADISKKRKNAKLMCWENSRSQPCQSLKYLSVATFQLQAQYDAILHSQEQDQGPCAKNCLAKVSHTRLAGATSDSQSSCFHRGWIHGIEKPVLKRRNRMLLLMVGRCCVKNCRSSSSIFRASSPARRTNLLQC